jgi:transposase
MIDRRTVFEIHRLFHEGYKIRKIARTLMLSRDSVKRYLDNPNPPKPVILRSSKLDPFKDQIQAYLQQDPSVSSAVLLQRLQPQGYTGGRSILGEYLQQIRPPKKRAYLRFESPPGQQFQIDWGHFGSLVYGKTPRKLYGLAVIEAHSRMLYAEFTHSQKQETLHQGLLNAFRFFQGTPKEIVTDNMLTAVLEREGAIIRFNEAFLEFLRPFQITPRACHPYQPHEKGKIEKGGIHYLRHNFWPLRTFTDLPDINRQLRHWLDTQANCRLHSTTGERPIDRFKPEALQTLPEFTPDCRQTLSVKVHSDFAVRFDGNFYSVPPWAIGKTVIVKADHQAVTIYLKEKALATHTRCWEKKQRIEHSVHREAACKRRPQEWLATEVSAFISLGEEAKAFLEGLSHTGQPIKKNLAQLLALKDRYGAPLLIQALKRALTHSAYGAHYVENILHQEKAPKQVHPPVELKRQDLNRIRLEEPHLSDYDACILKRKDHHA